MLDQVVEGVKRTADVGVTPVEERAAAGSDDDIPWVAIESADDVGKTSGCRAGFPKPGTQVCDFPTAEGFRGTATLRSHHMFRARKKLVDESGQRCATEVAASRGKQRPRMDDRGDLKVGKRFRDAQPSSTVASFL